MRRRAGAVSEPLTLRRLVTRHGALLGLTVVVPARGAGDDSPLELGAPGTHVTSLVGHLNLIRPNRVQVLGAAEIEHVRALDSTSWEGFARQVLEARPICLVVADALEPPGRLVQACSACGTPLLGARATSHQVVQQLMQFLSRTWARRTSTHGVFIEVMGVGVLLTGRPGVGKSELALELVSRGHRLIADDAPEFALVASGTVEGSCPPALRDFMEVRGLGIVNVRNLFGDSAVKPRRTLRMVINLEVQERREYTPEERLQGIRGSRDVLGVPIPQVSLPVAPGHNMAVLVECTVRNFILSMKGYHAADDFADRQNRIMSGEEIAEG